MMRIKLHRVPDGIECTIRIGEFHVGAASSDPAAALNAASGLALDLTKYMEKHPELAALLPPQTTAALAAIRIAAQAAKSGNLDAAAKHIGPAAVRAVTSILRSVL